MFRRYLFLGLMLVLGTVLVYLILQSRGEEARIVRKRPVEIVREAEPTATRAIAPRDLVAAGCRIQAENPAPGSAGPAIHVQLRNEGESSYSNVMLRFSHMGRSNKVLGTSNYLVAETLKAGAVLDLKDLVIDGIPAGTNRCEARILYADVLPE
jgi:hypothetical protein